MAVESLAPAGIASADRRLQRQRRIARRRAGTGGAAGMTCRCRTGWRRAAWRQSRRRTRRWRRRSPWRFAVGEDSFGLGGEQERGVDPEWAPADFGRQPFCQPQRLRVHRPGGFQGRAGTTGRAGLSRRRRSHRRAGDPGPVPMPSQSRPLGRAALSFAGCSRNLLGAARRGTEDAGTGSGHHRSTKHVSLGRLHAGVRVHADRDWVELKVAGEPSAESRPPENDTAGEPSGTRSNRKG